MIISIIFLIFIIYSNIVNSSYSIIKLSSFNETYFSLDNEFIIFEYENQVNNRIIDGGIYFIFDKGNKPTTKIYIYDSFDKIERGNYGFINYDYQTSLKETNYFAIKYNDTIYKDKAIYYIVIYDSSTIYEDLIYVSNNLYFYPLREPISYKHKLDFQMDLFFCIYIDKELYFHYQAKQISGILLNDAYRFLIWDENEQIYIDKLCSGINEYIKLKPNLYYFIQIGITHNPFFGGISELKLSFSKYGEKYWIKDDKTMKLDILTSQHILFFKNISNYEINETISVKGQINTTEYDEEYFYIKYYDSDDFEKLKDNFPSEKNNFDKVVGYLKNGGNFQFNIEKNNYSQKGFLIGFFIENDILFGIKPTALYINFTNKEDESKEKEEEKSDEKEEEKSDEKEEEEDKKSDEKEYNEDDNNKKDNDDKSNQIEINEYNINSIYYNIIYIVTGAVIVFSITFIIICRCYCNSKINNNNSLVNINVEKLLINGNSQDIKEVDTQKD